MISSGIGSEVRQADREYEAPSEPRGISAEEAGRADVYRLLALLLEGPPNEELRALLIGVADDGSDLGVALARVADAVRGQDPAWTRDAFGRLFVGAPAAKLMPYGSHYKSGQLYGRDLAELRMDLARLGIARAKDATEPEDHITSLFEIMSGLLTGAFGAAPLDIAEQSAFFAKHVQPWTPRFFRDMEAAAEDEFYHAVARFGGAFVALEVEAFDLP
ncbi:molecular chaperone TorD family protein [Marivibrio halodurans]|uniref:Molecular chaperone TorD family protein n=1 Tax=Marivibrio halodurans TaxID=2039722 RepID=A0A8J7SP09_9PROT|nr:molecular chaperone TorD family protein [Marivibrio halodurans]MBP5858333.1 molecular chaperone TorD family protein [Marivibrio halodurans]